VTFLVTGGAGYIGGVVVRQLLASGHEVIIFDDLRHGRRENVSAAAQLIQGSISDDGALDSLFSSYKIDGVLHFAALIEAGESMRDPATFFANNTAGSATLLHSMARHGVRRFVFSSTAAVYGDPEGVPIAEDARTAPVNAYGESKLLVERMLPWQARAHGLSYAVLRYFNVAGALPDYGEAHEPETHLIPQVLDVAMGKRASIKIFGTDYDTADGTCIRDYIHVADVGRAHLLAMQALTGSAAQSGPRELVYNLGNGCGFSVRQVIESARRVTGHPIPADGHKRRAGDAARLIADSEKIKRELDWAPEISELDDIVRSAWQWHQRKFGARS
jgi:UDP-glucose 4-epimerase